MTKTAFYCVHQTGDYKHNSEVTFREGFKAFGDDTTSHGIPQVTKSKGVFKNIFWMTFTIACTSGLLYHMYSITRTYLDRPVFVQVSQLHSRHMVFPAVTICNTNPVKRSLIHLSPRLQILLAKWGYDTTSSRRRRKRSSDCANPLYNTNTCFWELTNTYSQNDSKTACINEGGVLAVLDTEDKFNFIVNNGLTTNFVWVDLTWSSTQNAWLWQDTLPLGWANWGTTPNPATNPCAYFNFVQAFRKLYASSCAGAISGSVHIRGLCQKTVSNSEVTTTSSLTSIKETESSIIPETISALPITTTSHFQSAFSEREPYREDFKKENDILTTLAAIPLEEKKKIGYDLPEFIVKCIYSGKECYEWQFDYFFDAVHGNCYIFNSGWNTSQENLYSTEPGPNAGLTLYLNVKQEEYVEGISDSAGAVVVVKEQNQMPFPEDEGVFVVPGRSTSIAVSKVDISRLGNEYGNCKHEIDVRADENMYADHYPVNYTSNGCGKTCYQQQVIKTCGCADPQYPTTGQALGNYNTTSCDFRNQTQDDCVYGVNLKYIAGTLDCVCENACRYSFFKYTVSKVLWPNDKDQDTIFNLYNMSTSTSNNKQEILNRNALEVKVYFEEFNTETMTESPKYPLERFISDVGAITGLWLGCSLLSIIEFLELGLDMLVLAITGKKICCRNKSYGHTDTNLSNIRKKSHKKISTSSTDSLISNANSETENENAVTPARSRRISKLIQVEPHTQNYL